jgi:methylphosphotriester-DNA--protein-cysteine methyltransferase
MRATGLTQNHIHQFQRAQRAAALLQQGFSILDTVVEAGYFDQPHLTRSLKQWIGHTPAQVMRLS